MRIAVTGVNGQLGSDVIKLLLSCDSDISVVPITRKECDLISLESVRRFFNSIEFDVLINCAAYTNVEKAEVDADHCFLINSKSSYELSSICKAKGARFVHISTDYVFDGKQRTPYTETDSPAPLNVYGASKLMGESLARTECDDTLILRVASLFGEKGASGKGGNFITTILRHAREKGKLSVVNDQWMSPTWTGDVAKMILALLDKKAPAGIYHAVNSGVASWFDLASYACQLADVSVDITPVSSTVYPTIATRPAYSVLDNSKLQSIIGNIDSWQDAFRSYMRRSLVLQDL